MEQCSRCGCTDYSARVVYHNNRSEKVLVVKCHDCRRIIPLVVDDFTQESPQSEKCHQAWIKANSPTGGFW